MILLRRSPVAQRPTVSAEYMDALLAAADLVGLEYDEAKARRFAAVHGRVGRVRVALGFRFLNGVLERHVFGAYLSPSLPSAVMVGRGKAAAAVASGDPQFDRTFSAIGDPPLVHALLTGDVRGRITRLFERPHHSVQLGPERVLLRSEAAFPGDPRAMAGFVTQLAELAASLDSEPDRTARLFLNATKDPAEAVRAASAQALLDADPSVAVLAALVAARYAPSEARLEAFDRVADAELGEVGPAMLEAIRNGDRSLAETIIDHLSELGYREASPVIAEVIDRFDDEFTASCALSLGMLGDPSVEPGLIGLLSSEAKEVKRQAALALGQIGTTVAVRPLLELTEGFWTDKDVEKAALSAVEAIQARHGEGLSLADTVGELVSDED